ncbi:MAG TPA: flagellar biosynthetic protein FliO [Bacillota bacterium]|nr:flagellar biosynthetic protein FliO [Bacillota bacterium]HRU41919.1 flagellar biosynthetic protein FliO [Candidatus Diapherotrites archaeon]HOS69236.1 flagellar biosynthetic protein FliO [Bacillota bacterium]HQE65482.1 flagellar biosynthetic protein FliO [Bacillota bacterium]HQJ36866.1 flagellar biosynthetic protein FliO [Bacillota bacterium]
MNTGSAIYGILYFLFMSAVILAAAYYVTRFLSKRSIKNAGNKNLKILEAAPLGFDKSILLVKAGEQYLLLGSTQKSITLLSELDPEKLSIADDESFEAYLNSFQEENKTGMNSIKNNLNKLKSIVRGNRTDV